MQSVFEYQLHPTSTGVCVNCTFLDNNSTGCVAVVHQRISQLSSSGLMNIESSHKFTRSGDTAYGCIEGVNLSEYQIGVIDSQRSMIETTLSMLTCIYLLNFISQFVYYTHLNTNFYVSN